MERSDQEDAAWKKRDHTKEEAGWNSMLLKVPILLYAATSLAVQDKCLATGLRGN